MKKYLVKPFSEARNELPPDWLPGKTANLKMVGGLTIIAEENVFWDEFPIPGNIENGKFYAHEKGTHALCMQKHNRTKNEQAYAKKMGEEAWYEGKERYVLVEITSMKLRNKCLGR